MTISTKGSKKFDSNKKKFIIMVLLGMILPLNFPFWGFKKEATKEIIEHFELNKEANIIKIEKWHTILNLILCIPIIFICPFVCPFKLLLAANIIALANESTVYFYTIPKKSIPLFYIYVIMVGFLNSLLRIFINIIISSLFAKTREQNAHDKKKPNKHLNLFFSLINSMQKGYVMLTSFIIPNLVEKESQLIRKTNILKKYYPYFYCISITPVVASSVIYVLSLQVKVPKPRTKTKNYEGVSKSDRAQKDARIIKDLKESIYECVCITLKEYEWYISGTIFTLLYLAINHRKNRYFLYGIGLEKYSIENSVDNIFMFIAPIIIYYLFKLYRNNWMYMILQGTISIAGTILLAIPIALDLKSRIYTVFSLSVLGFAHILLSNTFYPMFVEIYPTKYVGTAFSVFNLFFSIVYLILNFTIELIYEMEDRVLKNIKEVIISFLMFISLLFAISTLLLTIRMLKKNELEKGNKKEEEKIK